MKTYSIDREYLRQVLVELLNIPSPTGFTDDIVHYVGQELRKMKIDFELTRRGAIRATMAGRLASPNRAVVAHLDTIGAMVKGLKENGRLALTPIGHWSSRFAEGARATVFTDDNLYRGTILPLKASGHIYDREIDTQPVSWEQVELRVDARVIERDHLCRLGIHPGDYVAIDPDPEIDQNGFINSRHLDDKAGVATLLASAKAIRDAGSTLPVDCHLLFTISEEIGSGASAILHQDVAEMVTVDNAASSSAQSTAESHVTIAMKDSSGPFDYHLTHKLIELCRKHGIEHRRDLFEYYRCDSASAIDAGNDIRTALVCFGLDGSHGYERTELETLVLLGKLLGLYMQSAPTFMRDSDELAGLDGFPSQIEA